MKRQFFVLISLVLIGFSVVSCDMKSVISPSVQLSSAVYRTTVEGVKDTITLSDSLNIGDTVCVTMLCNGYYDYLRSVAATTDTTKLKVSLAWDEDVISYLSDDADPEHGRLAFLPEKVYACITTLKYVPVASGTHRVEISILSSADEVYSQGAWHFFVAVK